MIASEISNPRPVHTTQSSTDPFIILLCDSKLLLKELCPMFLYVADNFFIEENLLRFKVKYSNLYLEGFGERSISRYV